MLCINCNFEAQKMLHETTTKPLFSIVHLHRLRRSKLTPPCLQGVFEFPRGLTGNNFDLVTRLDWDLASINVFISFRGSWAKQKRGKLFRRDSKGLLFSKDFRLAESASRNETAGITMPAIFYHP